MSAPQGAPPIVTRLVSAGLALVAIAVVLSATTSARDSTPRARAAADSLNAVAVIDGQPATARVIGAQRTGDAIVLRVDPDGDLATRDLIVSTAAKVTAAAITGTATPNRGALPALLQAAGDPARLLALRTLRFALQYDDAGHVVAITQVG